MMRYTHRSRRGQSGFTLLEALIALLLLAVIMGAFLAMLNTFSGLVKTQGNVADTTENMRYTIAALVRVTRMTGTGGLPLVTINSGGNLIPLAIDVADNVPAASTFESAITNTDFGVTSNRSTVAGTDVLRIRGVITSPNFDIFGGNLDDPTSPTWVKVPEVSPWSTDPLNPVYQDMTQPADATPRPFLISLQYPLNITPSYGGTRGYASYRVVAATNLAAQGSSPNKLQEYDINRMTYKTLNPNEESNVPSTQAYACGYLDDYIFFVANNEFNEPSLYRIQVNDATTAVYSAEELVPNVSNFQVSLGCDVNVDGSLSTNEWFMSDATTGPPSGDDLASLREVRLSVVSRTQDKDLKWTADSDQPENAANLSGDALKYRYRTITVRVALRSHPELVK